MSMQGSCRLICRLRYPSAGSPTSGVSWYATIHLMLFGWFWGFQQPSGPNSHLFATCPTGFILLACSISRNPRSMKWKRRPVGPFHRRRCDCCHSLGGSAPVLARWRRTHRRQASHASAMFDFCVDHQCVGPAARGSPAVWDHTLGESKVFPGSKEREHLNKSR